MPVDTRDPTAALSQLADEIARTVRHQGRAAETVAGGGEPVGRLAAIHEAHLAELLDEVEVMGGRPEDGGAMAAAVRTVLDTSPARESGRPGLARIVSDEERLAAAYDAAIAASSDHPEIRDLLRRQRSVLADYVAALRGD